MKSNPSLSIAQIHRENETDTHSKIINSHQQKLIESMSQEALRVRLIARYHNAQYTSPLRQQPTPFFFQRFCYELVLF